jgi:hypothetical protein
MSTPLFPAEQLAAALALLPPADTDVMPYTDLVCGLEVHSERERYYVTRLYSVELALLLDGSGGALALPAPRDAGHIQDIDLGPRWRDTLRTLRALLTHPRVAALIDQEGR